MSERVYKVLFLCTGNSARSILAEAILNHLGKGRFQAFSAGSYPTGKVNSYVLELLERQNMPVAGLRSKRWDEFAQPGAPALDFVFTVCDSAAGEVCPVWPGRPVTAHWGLEDPATAEGEEAARKAVSHAFRLLSQRIGVFVNLPFSRLDRLALEQEVQIIGRHPGDSPAQA